MNKKKANQRLAKEERSKQFPILNLSILITAILNIVGQMANIYILRMCKPIPMILMILYISGKNSVRDHLLPTLIQVGLIFSLVGDILLMSNEDAAFMLGTTFFLVAHILYILGFRIGEKVRDASNWQKLLINLITLVAIGMCFFNVYSLWDLMLNRFLYTLYGAVLCMMTILAIRRYQITTPLSYKFVIIGAILFAISDNALAMLKFNGIKSDFGRGIVMLTYYSGQYFIMHGSLHHSNLQNEITKFMKSKTRAQFEEA